MKPVNTLSGMSRFGRIGLAVAAMAEVIAGKSVAMSDDMRNSLPRIGRNAPARIRNVIGFMDRAGMPHARSGDKLTRRAIAGTVGLNFSKGPYHGWANIAKAGKKRRQK